MKITIDKLADAVYIYLQENGINKFGKTILIEELNLNGMLNFDIDVNKNIIGIEILPISFANNISKLNYTLLNSGINIFFSKNEISSSFKIQDDNIKISLDEKGNIVNIKIINIFDKISFSGNIVYKYY